MKKTSFKEWIIFCLAILFLMIGIHQSMEHGFWPSYWAYMIAASLLMWYGYTKKNTGPENEKPRTDLNTTAKPKSSKKRR